MDDKDIEILKHLSVDGRQSARQLSHRLNVSTVTILSRIKKLEAKNIIQGYSVRLNHELLGYDITAIIKIKTSQGKMLEIENEIAKCSIEKAYLDGKTDFKKPISCHLFPIRIKEYRNFDAVNYEEIKICEPACECGSKLEMPVYAFLKEPLIRKYGEAWYKELLEAVRILKG